MALAEASVALAVINEDVGIKEAELLSVLAKCSAELRLTTRVTFFSLGPSKSVRILTKWELI